MRIKFKAEEAKENNIFWVTMTDLMTALVLVFIVMFFYAFLQNNINNLNANLAKENATKVLQETLKEQDLEANVDPISGVVKISNLELFELNSYKLSNKGKAYLDKFAPAYIDSLFSNEYMQKNLDKIIIQGHTDSQTFVGLYSENEQYMKNMELSLNRAYSVANYMLQTKYNKANSEKLRKMFLVEGVSFSEPVIEDGKENFDKSRRVELKLSMKKKS